MKNAEQLSADMTADEALRAKFRESLNKLRGDKTLSITEAGRQVARELGYEISDEEAKKLITARRQASKGKLSDEDLGNVAGGFNYCYECGGKPICGW